ncbi:LacI family DNA-binding transcriptional regulator [Trueperella sp. LYQ141]|uniref:LacI family DNA-binding transcriptional regulator n=1 Tax=Trueperella sp. LYQ141 TaxID=3391058 RepID=UPI003983626D
MNRQQRVTIKEVAALAGVSVKTVSRAINKEYGVGKDTAEKVKQACLKLGYQADLSARSLRRADRRTQSIGLVISSVANEFDSVIHAAIEQVAHERNVMVLAVSTEDDIEREQDYVQRLMQRQIDGLIIASVGANQEWLTGVANTIPVVFIDRQPTPLIADAVVSQNYAGAKLAIKHLLAHGHRRIGFIGDLSTIQTAQERQKGYLDALTEAGITPNPSYHLTNIRNLSGLGKQITALVHAPEPVTAFLAARNNLAAEAMRFVTSLRLNDQVAIVSFDDIEYADLFPTPLTAVAQDVSKIGTLAAQRIFDRLDGTVTGKPELIELPVHLIPRGSGEVRAQPTSPLAG